MRESVSQWAVLACALKDNTILDTLDVKWFSGLARLTYVELISLMEPNKDVLLEKMLEAHPEIYSEVATYLEQGASTPRPESHLKAVRSAYLDRAIKEAIEDAVSQIESGTSRMIVAENLQNELGSLSMSVDTKEFELNDILDGEDTINTGMSHINGIEQWEMGNIVALGGDTGTFKTTKAIFMCLMALNANPELEVAYFSKEQPVREIWHKIISCRYGKDYSYVQHNLNHTNPQFVQQIKDAMSKDSVLRRFRVIDQKNFNTISDVIYHIRSRKASKLLWVIDYLTCLSFDTKNYNTSIADGLRRLKNATIATNSLGIIINQFKDGWNLSKDGGVIKRLPTSADIIWTSEIKNLAAYIFLLFHPCNYFEGYDKELLILSVAKLRHTDSKAKIPFIVDGQYQTFNKIFHVEELKKAISAVKDFTTFRRN